ncbi:MAG: macro domain-containing protein [Planctomycetes bacterium]|nr:macro domain-containing protein [Planctomycetota bacterium]
MDLEAAKAKIELMQGDITEMEADAIVNAANSDLILGAGVSGAIGRRGGKVIQDECDRIRFVPLGDAVVTAAGELKARYVIHAVSMEIGHFTTERNVALATRNALLRAEELKLKTIAFPAIGTGAAALAPEFSARAMLETMADHVSRGTSLEHIYVVLFNEEILAVFKEVFDQLGAPRPLRR